MFFIGIVSIIIIVIAFCLFIDRVVLWDCDEHGSGIKGYINKKNKT